MFTTRFIVNHFRKQQQAIWLSWTISGTNCSSTSMVEGCFLLIFADHYHYYYINPCEIHIRILVIFYHVNFCQAWRFGVQKHPEGSRSWDSILFGKTHVDLKRKKKSDFDFARSWERFVGWLLLAGLTLGILQSTEIYLACWQLKALAKHSYHLTWRKCY